MSRNRSIPYNDGSSFSGVLQDAKESGVAKMLFEEPKSFHNMQLKPLWRRPAFLRQAILPIITFVYFIIVSVFLMTNSPGQFLANLTSMGPSLQSFIRIHQLLIHFLSFYLLAISFCLCYKKIGYLTLTLSIIGYAIFTELFQFFLPNRHSDIPDLLANLTGIGCGFASVWIILLMKARFCTGNSTPTR